MARQPRLALPDLPHLVIQRGHSGQPVFTEAADRQAYLQVLQEAARAEAVQLHAWALLNTEVQLLLTPSTGPALGRLMQAVGRRYVSAYNRRHGRAGTLWDGRFRCALVEPGAMRLLALRWVDGDPNSQAGAQRLSSAPQRLGGPRDADLVDPPEYWQLGNTPFEREAAYRELLTLGLPAASAEAVRRAALTGKVLGSAAFGRGLGGLARLRQTPRPRGRPRRAGV